jgi:predicted enzyme related to lactoylglutathione lyase
MKMNYFVVGTNDMDATKAFYDALFAQSGLQFLRSRASSAFRHLTE